MGAFFYRLFRASILNMKNRKLIVFLLPFVLSGCVGNPTFVPFREYVEEKLTKQDLNNDIYYSQSEYSSLEYQNFDKTIGTINSFRDLYSSTNDGRQYLNMASTGEQKMLVIPVSFKDTNTSNKAYKRTFIQNAFFGEENKTTYESVASFYNKSSYGHLKLSGEVSDWFNLDLTPSELTSTIHASNLASRYVLDKAVDWYKANYDNILDFDNDHDGYIDGVFLIYDTPFQNKSSIFWAYTDRISKNERFLGANGVWQTLNTDPVYLNGYSWASYDFLKAINNTVDSHIITHETGHLFGLDDYYSSYDYQPTGFMDMMDMNLGDHTGYSKMLLNWTTPYVIKNVGEITIKPFESSGELILIPANESWNGTPYDEYLLLEFYAPTYLNRYDSSTSFTYYDKNGTPRVASLFSEYGLKVYHVDARAAYISNKQSKQIISYFDDAELNTKLDTYRQNNSSYYIGLGNSNNIPSSANKNPLYHLLEKSGNNTFLTGKTATNDTLFKLNDSFGINTFTNFVFDNGKSLKYNFVITALSSGGITINFAQNNA